jgi:HPt (histidine-containing phosphotransfer) domain-containing protein
LAHTAKGVSGTIGAEGLTGISIQLESAIKSDGGDHIPSLLTAFSEELRRVMDAADRLLQFEDAMRVGDLRGRTSVQSNRGTEPDASRLKALFEELSNLIDNRDSDALKLVGKIKAILGPAHMTPDVRELESQLNRFAFEQAQKTLRDLIL